MFKRYPMYKCYAIVIAVCVFASVGHADKTYSLVDLKSLVAEGAFQEAFMHLSDVPPSQRKADWLDVAAAASGGVLGTLSTDDGAALAMIDEIDRRYPQVLKAAKYIKPRNELGLKGLEGCFQQTRGYWRSYGLDNCLKLGMRFVESSGGDRALALKVAKLVRGSAISYGALLFFRHALGGKDDKAVCKDPDLQLAVVSGLGLPPNNVNAAEARTMMATCWDELKDPVVKAFDQDSKGGYVHQNTCEQLKAKRLLSPLQAKRCTKK